MKILILIMNKYTHAILACYSVSMLRIVNKCHVDSNQRCSISCQNLTSNYRHQAKKREREQRELVYSQLHCLQDLIRKITKC